MACNSFGYDCDVQVDVAAARGSLNNFHAYTIGMCTRVKNEGHYLGEWIDFHRLAGVCLRVDRAVSRSGQFHSGVTLSGPWSSALTCVCCTHLPPTHHRNQVSKFYIWYDESDDNTLQVLTNYQKMTSNVRVFNITTLPGHEAGQQPFAHAEHSFRDACLRDNPDRVRWMAFIDADEFMFPALRLNLVRPHAHPQDTHLALRMRAHFAVGFRAFLTPGLVLIVRPG